jgi:flagellar biosynthesis GTPase FlhF
MTQNIGRGIRSVRVESGSAFQQHNNNHHHYNTINVVQRRFYAAAVKPSEPIQNASPGESQDKLVATISLKQKNRRLYVADAALAVIMIGTTMLALALTQVDKESIDKGREQIARVGLWWKDQFPVATEEENAEIDDEVDVVVDSELEEQDAAVDAEVAQLVHVIEDAPAVDDDEDDDEDDDDDDDDEDDEDEAARARHLEERRLHSEAKEWRRMERKREKVERRLAQKRRAEEELERWRAEKDALQQKKAERKQEEKLKKRVERIKDWVPNPSAPLLAWCCVTLGSIAVFKYARWRQWKRRQFMTRMNFSINYVRNGRLRVRTLTEKPTEEVLYCNTVAVDRLTRAAMRCNAGEPFITMETSDESRLVHRAIDNDLSAMSATGYFYDQCQLPVVRKPFIFGIANEPGFALLKVRVIVIAEDQLRNLPPTMPELETPYHLHRWESLKVMKRRYFEQLDRIDANDSDLFTRFEIVLPAYRLDVGGDESKRYF